MLQAWYSKLLNGSGNLSPESRPRWKMMGWSVWSLNNHNENDDYVVIVMIMIMIITIIMKKIIVCDNNYLNYNDH